MSLIKCTKCGELYADSYKKCPFCAEDEEFFKGKIKNKGTRKEEKSAKRPSAAGPLLILAVLAIIAALIWVIFGKGIHLPSRENQGGQTQTEEPAKNSEESSEGALELNKSALLLQVGQSETLTVTGVEKDASVSWMSSDPSVAVVTDSGTVKGIDVGSAIITATCGDESVTCAVSVEEESEDPGTDDPGTTTPGTTTPTKPTTEDTKVDLTKMTLTIPEYGDLAVPKNSSDPEIDYDMSMQSNEISCTLKVGGVSGKVTWSSSNSSVATIGEDGKLTRISSGTATITGKIGTASFTVLVRCQ